MLKNLAPPFFVLSAALACGPAPHAATPASEAPSEEVPPGAAPEPATPANGSGAAASDRTGGESVASSAAAPPASGGDDGLDADIAELSASTQSSGAATGATPTAAPAGSAETAGWDIVYRVTPKGLVIEIDGIHLRPEAKSVRESGGSYAIRLVLNAESFDGRRFWLDKPSEGPLSIAGKVEAKGGKSSRFEDKRGASSEELVMSESPRHFEQRWPGRGQPKLWAGQTVTLEVGLWGVRAESGRARPVRRLFVVKMVAGDRAQPVITPPAMDWGS